ncbi:HER2 [Candida pseudojiufengensis]|uniref:HER2 n=1 Tax=Candida pseudojiufengensis TaxID=497109 RepID=UPI002223FED4|nr:HER2 [Candida pseudojiufengensis]KAI5958500.1 HER2 [Candida pseudojiufengensis]
MIKQRLLRYSTSGITINDPYNSLITKCTIKPSNTKSNAPLYNTTYALKDNIVDNQTTSTAASETLFNYKSPFNATVTELLSQDGSTCIGKANLDEFGMGSSNQNSYFGKVINPYDIETVPGGSSGGSGAAAAGGLCDFAIGTDTGGSVRLPGSYCNVFGFKPSYGRISRWGVIPYAQTLDTVGILSKDLEMIEKVYKVLNVEDIKDPTSLPNEVRNSIEKTKTTRNLTIGIPKEFFIEEVSEKVKNTWIKVIEKFIDLGHTVKTISIDSIKKTLPAYYILATTEAASNLARYDGIRYGYTERPVNVNDNPMQLIYDNRSNSLGDEVKRRILLGNYTLGSDSGNHYLQATKARELLTKQISSFFKNKHVFWPELQKQKDICDLLVVPTAMDVAPNFDSYLLESKENVLNEYVNDVFTVPASLAGVPTISVPFDGVGIQLIGQFGDDEFVLKVANEIKE